MVTVCIDRVNLTDISHQLRAGHGTIGATDEEKYGDFEADDVHVDDLNDMNNECFAVDTVIAELEKQLLSIRLLTIEGGEFSLFETYGNDSYPRISQHYDISLLNKYFLEDNVEEPPHASHVVDRLMHIGVTDRAKSQTIVSILQSSRDPNVAELRDFVARKLKQDEISIVSRMVCPYLT